MSFARFDPHRITVPTPLGDVAAIDIGRSGRRRPRCFVHGVGTNAHLWAGVLDALAADRRCIAIDLPGHGRSPVTAEQDLTLGALADLVEAFCATHALDTVDLVAHDTGGAVAQIFAARHPERLRSFVLTNCDCHDNIPPAGFLPTVELARAGLIAPGAPDLLADLLGARDLVFAMGYEDVTILDEARMQDYLGTALGTPERALAFERMLAGLEPTELLAAEPALARPRRARRSSSGAPATSSSSCRGPTGCATRSAGARRGRRDPGRQALLARRAPRRPRPAPPPPLELGRRAASRTRNDGRRPAHRPLRAAEACATDRGGGGPGTVPAVQIGLTMFATDQTMDVVALARAAEERGFHSLYLPEHTHIPVTRRTPPPTGGDTLAEEYKRTLDPLVALAMAARRSPNASSSAPASASSRSASRS